MRAMVGASEKLLIPADLPADWEHPTNDVPKVESPAAPRERDSRSMTRRQNDRTLQPNLQKITPTRPAALPLTRPANRSNETQKPDHEYIMSQSWAEALRMVKGPTQIVRQTFKNEIDAISRFSEAVVQIPTDNTNKLCIWGTEKQCDLAVSQLDVWQKNLLADRLKAKQIIWPKSSAYDGRKEHRNMQESYENYAAQLFKDIDDTTFAFEAYLIWPSTYDLDAYLKTFETGALQDISINFRCHFHHEKRGNLRFSRIKSQTEEQLIAAYQRLVGMAKEMVSGQSSGIHANYFLLPPQQVYRKKIKIEHDPVAKNFTFTLNGDLDADLCNTDWNNLVDKYDTRARDAVSDSFTAFIQGLYVSENHVRFRVEFGCFGLKSFQRPHNGANLYDTDEFLEMIQNPQIKLSECALKPKGKDMFNLAEMLEKMPEFYQPEETFKVLYDFQHANKSSFVRLETDLVRGYDPDETEIRGQRWLQFNTHNANGADFKLNILDLHNPSFTIRADCHDLLSPSRITKDMKLFQSTHKFKPASDGLRTFPRRRSIVPPGQRDLMTITEITALKLRVRGMDGTFELQRADVFDHRNGKNSPWPISSRWSASYYYYGWDSRFDEFANITPGQNVSWTRDLTSFFPMEASEENANLLLPPDFVKFWEELRLIQAYLATAISELPLSDD